MAKLPSIEEMAKDVAQRAMQEITINDMPLLEFLEKVNNAVENSNCNLTTCRYNKDGKKSALRYQERCCVMMAFYCKRKISKSKRKTIGCKGCKYYEKVFWNGHYQWRCTC